MGAEAAECYQRATRPSLMATVLSSLHTAVPGEQEIAREPLHCIDTDHAEFSTEHPFVACKEINRASGAWRVRIQSEHADAAVLYPNAIRLQARAISEQGKSSFTWSNALIAGSGNAARLKFRVLVNDGEPAAIEVFPQPAAPSSRARSSAMTFSWPAA